MHYDRSATQIIMSSYDNIIIGGWSRYRMGLADLGYPAMRHTGSAIRFKECVAAGDLPEPALIRAISSYGHLNLG
jgi:hypothetical protein